MKVDVTTLGSFQKRLSFVVPPDQVASRLDAAYKRYANRARLPGFRPGKVPRKVLEQRFGQQIEGEVANELINNSYRSALQTHGIQALGQPALDDAGAVAAVDGFAFTVTVEVRPEISLQKWTGVDVVYPAVTLDAEEIDGAVKARLESQAKLESVEGRNLQKGDLALVEIEIKDGDTVVAHEPGTMIRTEADPYFPGIESFLEGMAPDEERTGAVSFAADARTDAIAGRKLDVRAKLLALQSYTVPDLTDEVATEMGYEGGIPAMRQAIEAQLRQGRDEMARNQARANLLESLIAANTFDVPTSMVEQSLNMLMEELKLQTAYRTGRDPRTIGFSDAQVADLRVRAAFAAKAGLILEWVAKNENIKVEEADLKRKYTELADQRGQTVEAVKGWFTKESAIDELKDRILEEKTLDWLLERANLVDAPAAAPAADEKPAKKAAKGKKAEAEAEAAPAPAAEEKPAKKAKGKKAEAEAPAVDLSVLDGKIDALKEALSSGSLDAQLDALLAAETGGRNRKGAVQAIEGRKKELAGG